MLFLATSCSWTPLSPKVYHPTGGNRKKSNCGLKKQRLSRSEHEKSGRQTLRILNSWWQDRNALSASRKPGTTELSREIFAHRFRRLPTSFRQPSRFPWICQSTSRCSSLPQRMDQHGAMNQCGTQYVKYSLKSDTRFGIENSTKAFSSASQRNLHWTRSQ